MSDDMPAIDLADIDTFVRGEHHACLRSYAAKTGSAGIRWTAAVSRRLV